VFRRHSKESSNSRDCPGENQSQCSAFIEVFDETGFFETVALVEPFGRIFRMSDKIYRLDIKSIRLESFDD